MAIRKYPIPSVGDVFNDLTVTKVYRIDSTNTKMGVIKVDLVCLCGNSVLNKSLGHLHETKNRKPTRRCTKCAYKETGKSARISTIEPNKKRVFSGYKNSAKLRKINWSISYETFLNFIEGECVYCGRSNLSYLQPPTISPWSIEYRYTGIDRVDSNKGYIMGNIQTCCKTCNYAKLQMSDEEFWSWIKKIVDRNSERF